MIFGGKLLITGVVFLVVSLVLWAMLVESEFAFYHPKEGGVLLAALSVAAFASLVATLGGFLMWVWA